MPIKKYATGEKGQPFGVCFFLLYVKMDSTKQFGNIKENVERENLARRNYEKKWGYLSEKQKNKFYNQNEIANEMSNSGFKAKCPYIYTEHGDSYFVSEDMYNTLIATCRCGRQKSALHNIKCLQKEQCKYLEETIAVSDDKGIANSGGRRIPNIPQTSAGFVGWLPCRYQKWEQSTKYVSPKINMPGYKMDDHPYSHVFIG